MSQLERPWMVLTAEPVVSVYPSRVGQATSVPRSIGVLGKHLWSRSHAQCSVAVSLGPCHAGPQHQSTSSADTTGQKGTFCQGKWL